MKTEKMIRNKFTKIQVVTLDGGCFNFLLSVSISMYCFHIWGETVIPR